MDSPIPTNFRFLEIIGAGTFGEVWKVQIPTAKSPGHLAAVKISYCSFNSTEAQRELKSLRLAASFEFAGLIPILQITEAIGRLMIVMELADCTYWQFIVRNPQQTLIETVSYLEKCAHTIDSIAANGIIHGGISPAEIVLKQGLPYFIDLSLLHKVGETCPQVSSDSLLRWACMSPEMRCRKPTLQSDQYSLAATYAMLRMRRLPISNPCDQLAKLADLGVEETLVLERALSEDADSRFHTCSEFTSNLNKAILQDLKTNGGAI
jgi:serine/threonine protein kinase